MMDVCDYIEKQRLNAYSLHPAIEFVDQALVDEAKEKGYKLYPYTVNSRSNAELMKTFGVDGIITNYPDLLG